VKKRDCARCGTHRHIRHGFPDGPICTTCFQQATNTHGACHQCGAQRMLIGRSPNGDPLCRDCAGIAVDFRCSRCGHEAEIYRKHTCIRCCLRDDLAHLLDDGTGTTPPPLRPFLESLVNMQRPRSGVTWMRRPAVQNLLTGLADGTIELSHHGLDQRPEHIKTVGHIRELLVASSALPARDTTLHRFETDIASKLEAIDEATERSVVKSYLTWTRLRHLRSLAADRRSTEAGVRYARQELTVTINLIEWLHATDSCLAECDQTLLDRWIVTGPSTRRRCATFVAWAVNHHHITNDCQIPQAARTATAPLSEDKRIELLRRLIDPTADQQLAPRLAAVLILLYGPTIDTIRHLRVADVTADGDDTTILLATDPALVPPRVATMITSQIAHGQNMATAANPTSPWLFPGQRAGHPITYQQLLDRIHELGPNVRPARSAALRELVLTIPAPVLTTILGYTAATLDRHVSQSGTPWLAYATRHG